jgi:hypothetical protein
MWMLTGRCAYTADCLKYLSGCDHTCPTAGEYPRLEPERIHDAWAAKRRLLCSPHAPVLLANSEWMRNFAQSLFPPRPNREPSCGPSIAALRLGVPLDIFRPREQRLCRELFDLPADRFIILTSATTVDDPRKGIRHLAMALQHLQLPDLLVVALGRFEPGRTPPIPGMRALGYIEEPRRLAMLYAAGSTPPSICSLVRACRRPSGRYSSRRRPAERRAWATPSAASPRRSWTASPDGWRQP